jgi:hypothetical protein
MEVDEEMEDNEGEDLDLETFQGGKDGAGGVESSPEKKQEKKRIRKSVELEEPTDKMASAASSFEEGRRGQ